MPMHLEGVLPETRGRLHAALGPAGPPGDVAFLDLGDPEWRRRLQTVVGPVIVLGGAEPEALAALEAGADDWLPLDRVEAAALAEAVGKARARHRAAEPEGPRLRRRTVARVSRVVAHEINNSLSAILMYAGLLLERTPPGDPGHDAAEGMSEATQRAASLVRVLLSCDRPGPARARAVDLHRLLLERAPLLRLVLGGDSRVDLDLPGDLPPVRTDAARLEEVLLTLAVLLEGRRVLTLATSRDEAGGVRLSARWEGPPLTTRQRAPLRERLEEMDARLLPPGEAPLLEVLLPEAR